MQVNINQLYTVAYLNANQLKQEWNVQKIMMETEEFLFVQVCVRVFMYLEWS